ncbi:MAG: flotillin family protein [Spirochaetota bacterium]
MQIPFLLLAASGSCLAILIILAVLMKLRYRRIRPNEMLIVYGARPKKKAVAAGEAHAFRVVEHGGAFIMPLIERSAGISLATMEIPFSIKSALTKTGVPVSINGVAQVRIRPEARTLIKAVPLILDKSEDEMRRIVLNLLEGHILEAVATIEPEQLHLRLPDTARKFTDAAREDLIKIGYETLTLVIEKVWDDNGYFDSFGKAQIAEVRAEASLGEAKANVKRLKAEKEVAETAKEFEVAIAQAQRIISENKAKADIAYEIEKAKIDRR